MNRIGSALFLAVASLAMQACVTGGSDEGKDGTAPVASRRHKAPEASYSALDSLVSISLRGSREGDEASYWIYRNDTLLDMPDFAGKDSGSGFRYHLVDSLKAAGDYTYYVRYGAAGDSLSGKSNTFTYSYAGPSPSGAVRAYADSIRGGTATIVLHPRADRHPGGARFERKIGAEGKIALLDSLEGPPGPAGQGYGYFDTAFIAEDTVVYYRASAWDAENEKWLEPTAWDTVRIRNESWNYQPAGAIQNQGNQVSAFVTSLPSGVSRSMLYLCRNGSPSRSGRKRVDSAEAGASFQTPVSLADAPDSGTYWYWLEAVDQFGRESFRSTPKQIHFTGNPVGPAITSLQNSGTEFQIRFFAGGVFSGYVLQRVQDTSKTASEIDTLAGTGDVASYDRPPADGVWFYRVIGVSQDGSRSDPGPWARSEPFHYAPAYVGLSVSIVNRGDHVEATLGSNVPYYPSYLILFRSKFSSGKDSVAIDTVLTNYPSVPKLQDTPSIGTWYYQVLQVPVDPSLSPTLYRSTPFRIDFTGKRTGPPIQSLQVNAGSIGISIAPDPDLAAWILERSPDGKSDWSAIDTLPIATTTKNDRPPEAGFWQYRTRGILPNLQATDPGSAARTSTPWSNAQTWSYSLTAAISNLGIRVEATGNAYSSNQTTRLMRGTTADYADGKEVARADSTYSFTLQDTPPKGTWYYWVEQPASDTYSSGSRSAAVKVEFTGAPEIVALYRLANGVQVTLPRATYGDTLELWRAYGKPEDTAGYGKVKSTVYYGYSDAVVDDSVDKKAPAFYSYRLAIIHQGRRSDLGAYRTIYFEP